MFFNNFSSTKANTLVLWLPHGSHLNLSWNIFIIIIIIMITVPSLWVLPSLFSRSIPLSLSWSLTFSLLFKTLPVLFKPQVRSLLWFQSGPKNMVDKEASWWKSNTVISIHLHAMIRSFIRQHTNKLFAPGHSCGTKLLAVRPPLRLNFIPLLRVVITPSVTSESTGR